MDLLVLVNGSKQHNWALLNLFCRAGNLLVKAGMLLSQGRQQVFGNILSILKATCWTGFWENTA